MENTDPNHTKESPTNLELLATTPNAIDAADQTAIQSQQWIAIVIQLTLLSITSTTDITTIHYYPELWREIISRAFKLVGLREPSSISFSPNERQFVLYYRIENVIQETPALKRAFAKLFRQLRPVQFVSAGTIQPRADQSLLEAKVALSIGPKMWPQAKVFSFSELGIASVITQNHNVREQFAANILRELDPELRTTLESLFQNNLNLAETARELKIHRNTAVYRLERISELTGLDPRTFDDALHLKIALMIEKL